LILNIVYYVLKIVYFFFIFFKFFCNQFCNQFDRKYDRKHDENMMRNMIENMIESLITLIGNLVESRSAIEFKSTRQVDQVESRVWLNSIELSWSLSTQLNSETQIELSWATRTWQQIYLQLTILSMISFINDKEYLVLLKMTFNFW